MVLLAVCQQTSLRQVFQGYEGQTVPPPEMVDFKLTFLPDDGDYRVHAECALVGQETSRLPGAQLTRLQALSKPFHQGAIGEIAEAVRIGKEIHKALFQGEIGGMFTRAAKLSRQEGGLRLVLRCPQIEDLHGIAWELLHDGSWFLAIDPQTPVVRYVEMQEAVYAPRITRPLRVLFTTAGPRGVQPLDLETEEQMLRLALDHLVGTVDLEVERHISRDRLQFRLQNAQAQGRPFHVWHHGGHGRLAGTADVGEFELLLERNGEMEPVSVATLAPMLKEFPQLCMVVLNVCHGAAQAGLATALACRNLPMALGFHTRIEDQAALKFAAYFYKGLIRSTVEVALTHARLALAFRGGHPLTWARPLLFSRTLRAVRLVSG